MIWTVTQKQVVSAINKQVKEEKPTVDKVKEWLDVGQGLGKALGACAHELNVEVNAFAQSPVGRFAMFLIFYKVVGAKLLSTVLVLIGWCVITMILIWSFRKFHMPIKVKDKDGKEHIQTYDFNSRDAKCCSATIHVILFAAITLVVLLII